ncbi:MAG: glycosyltransferase family 39 protein [Lachnospiraceae bacterium]|nr:glycosyltransferase family 39 protein [Lachnospiraceae bacterium]
MELLARHSYEVSTYNRPDHFEIKCDAVIFTFYSLLRYHTLPYKIASEHKMEFYVLARLLTTVFGTALIPLCVAYIGLLLNEQRKMLIRLSQLFTAFFVAFSAIFVQHSAYATPDIVLTFFVILFAYYQAKYLDDGNRKNLIRCAIITGIGITIKYPAALLCIAIAATVVIRAITTDKKPIMIIRYGLLSVFVVGLTIFVLAPNLFTNIYQVYVHIIKESGGSNLGAGGLGIAGNFIFYCTTLLDDLGLIVAPFFIIGLIYIIRLRGLRHLSLLTGLLFWICMSALSLHWVRWGIPFYPFYHIVAAIGMSACIQWFASHKASKNTQFIAGILTKSIIFLIMLNTVLCGLCITKFSTLPDLRYSTREDLEKNGIRIDNTLYEAYTPFAPTDGDNLISMMSVSQDNSTLTISSKGEKKEYLMISGITKKRVLSDNVKHPNLISVYRWLDQHGRIVYQALSDGDYQTDMSICKNIINSIRYLVTKHQTTGGSVLVYESPF